MLSRASGPVNALTSAHERSDAYRNLDVEADTNGAFSTRSLHIRIKTFCALCIASRHRHFLHHVKHRYRSKLEPQMQLQFCWVSFRCSGRDVTVNHPDGPRRSDSHISLHTKIRTLSHVPSSLDL